MKKLYIFLLAVIVVSCDDNSDASFAPGGSGTGSSLARLTIKDNFIYLVNDNALYSISISAPEKPVITDHVSVGIGIESIYPYYDYLLIGSAQAMYIYSTLNDPSRPEFLSEFQHWEACDPVVAQGDYAYVTLRSGSQCAPWSPNQLDVVNISDPRNPFAAGSLQMKNPHGLAVRDNILLVCEGAHGLAQVDITNPTQPRLDSLYSGFHAYDVIIRNDLVIVTGNDGYFQFDLSSGYLQQISEIEFL
ncbi:MAG: LVIVD repeat-containing protein [Candidatus Cyclobacteriaceae bacterium M2_1C_046]